MSAENINYYRYPPPTLPHATTAMYSQSQHQQQQNQHQQPKHPHQQTQNQHQQPQNQHQQPQNQHQQPQNQHQQPQNLHQQPQNQHQQHLQVPLQQTHRQWNWDTQSFLPQDFTTPPPALPFPLPSVHLSNHPLSRSTYHTPPTRQRHYSPRGRSNWENREKPNYKRPRYGDDDGSEPKGKPLKKKKKPLSQNVPSKKDWSVEDSERALAVEKEHNKRHKKRSLIIKFPDPELNKEIVARFHGDIENVHFQQPSAARFCFVTLKETADAEKVMEKLNKVKFGDGLLTAEYKKDREDDQMIGPGEIDPLTLYVGNLAQEVTIEDMEKTYPKCKRIDIGYAKKIKNTRYAFVTFKNIDDSIAAFKKTHGQQMYSKSLIVRFRRLHGTIGMPGDTKAQNPSKGAVNDADSIYSEGVPETPSGRDSIATTVTSFESDSFDHDTDGTHSVTQSKVKVKTEEDYDRKPYGLPTYESPFAPGPIAITNHKPIYNKEMKTELKSEPLYWDSYNKSSIQKEIQTIEIKEEPIAEEEEYGFQNEYHEFMHRDSESGDDDDNLLDRPIDFDRLYHEMETHDQVIKSLKSENG